MGEQPLPKNFCCNLSSINLAEFVINPYTDAAYFSYSAFEKAVHTMVEYLDDIVDLNAPRHPLPAQRENSLNYRNIGLGVFGYASMLMRLGIRYGRGEALPLTHNIFNTMLRSAVKASSYLATTRGTFPKYDEKIWESKIITKHFSSKEIEELKAQGLRNCSLLSIAPTGSIATMLGETGGCEPEYAISYTRRTVGLTDNEDHYYTMYCKSAQDYMRLIGNTTLPNYFIGSSDINPIDRVKTQSVMQKYIDTAISSTVNLPETCTEEEMAQIYLEAWKYGLKGLTIFRANCKRAGILTTSTPDTDTSAPQPTLQRGDILNCSNDLTGKKRKLTTGCGSLHVLAFFDPANGDMQEVYLSKGSTGGCQNFMVGLSRTISLLCRAGVDVYTIKDQLDSTGSCPSYATRSATKHDTSKGSCCPMAVGNALIEMYEEMLEELGMDEEPEETPQPPVHCKQCEEDQDINIDDKVRCPECGEPLVFEGGCNSCKNCGYSKCG